MTVSDKNKLDSIATGANKYIHPTTSGNKHIPAGGTSGNILRWGSDGTAVWGKEVMSESDKKKLEFLSVIRSRILRKHLPQMILKQSLKK